MTACSCRRFRGGRNVRFAGCWSTPGSPAFRAEGRAATARAMGCQGAAVPAGHGAQPLERNHRKLVVIDGPKSPTSAASGCAMSGAQTAALRAARGAALPTSGATTTSAPQGPAVNDVQRAFAQNWREAGGDLFPAGRATGDRRSARRASPSSLPPPAMSPTVSARCACSSARPAAASSPTPTSFRTVAAAAAPPKRPVTGSRCRVIAPGGKNDLPWRSLPRAAQIYRQLLSAGVKIFGTSR